MRQHFLYGLRLLRKSPAFAVTSILIVALGVGATTAIFSVVYGVMLRPLPFRDPGRLVSLWTISPKLNLARVQVNGADRRDWQARNHVLTEIALVRAVASFNLTGEGEPERLFAARVSASLFRVLGVAPAIGRAFTDEENEIGRDQVVLLSDGLWSRRFGRDPSIVGRTILLSGIPHTVAGVMGPDFRYPARETQIWTPLTVGPDELSRKDPAYNYVAIARLKPGVTIGQAQAEMDGIAARLAAEFPETNDHAGVEVVPLLDDMVSGVRRMLQVLLGAVSCLLLIACLNLANLLGARSASRAREFAVRLALGASRRALAAQAIAEVIPIAVAGGALGIVAATWGVDAFVPLAPPGLPRVESIGISVPVLAFSLGVLALTALVAGLLPAAQSWASDSTAATREDSRSLAGGRRQSRTRALLVVSQVALVLPLLVGAGLLIRSFSALVRVDSGFNPANVLTLQMAIPRSKYTDDPAVAAFCGRVVERVAALPDVASAGMVNRLPLAGVGQINLLHFETADPDTVVSTDTRSVTPDYFRTVGIRLIEGRLFTEHDMDTVATPTRYGPMPNIGIVDERLARTLWPGQSAIGKRFRFGLEGMPWMHVVGVVGHIRTDALDIDPRPQVYFNYRQRAQDRMALAVRGRGRDIRLFTTAILQAVRDVDPEQPVSDVRTLDEVIDRSTGQRWLNMTLVTAFALIALVLASIGLYGVVAYGVTRELREFGIRVALGAGAADITGLVLRRGLLLALSGVVIGLTAALALTRVMRSLLFGVEPTDPASFAAAAALLVSVALVASYLPARRASRVDPALTLKAE